MDGNDIVYSSPDRSLEFINRDKVTTINYEVSVKSVAGVNKYFIDEIHGSSLKFETGNTYVFDLSNVPSNHPFKLSSSIDGKWGGGQE